MADQTSSSDFSQVVKQQWTENQLREEVAELKSMLEKKEKEYQRLSVELQEERKKRETIERKASEMIQALQQREKELQAELEKKEKEGLLLKKEINVLKNALEEEKSKGLMQIMKEKMKGKR